MNEQRSIFSNTPVETYRVGDHWVLVKREDLCAPYPGPGFAKIRGIAEFLRGLHGVPAVGVLSTLVSRAGWGTAYICSELGTTCWNYHPKTERADLPVHRYCKEVEKFGGINIPLPNSRGSLLWARAAKDLKARGGTGAIMLPHHLALKETIEQTALEAAQTMQQVGRVGTVVIPVGSGTLAAGVLRGIALAKGIAPVQRVIGVTASVGVSTARRRQSIIHKAGISIGGFFGAIGEFDVQGTTLAYLQEAPVLAPFPCDPFYDGKCWAWLKEHIHELPQPILFWNIGGEDHG